jgi:hypothetical protein
MNLNNFDELKKRVSSLENMKPRYRINYLCSECLSTEGHAWIVDASIAEEQDKENNSEIRYVGVCPKCRSIDTNYGVDVAVLYSGEEEYLCFDTFPIDAILEELFHV